MPSSLGSSQPRDPTCVSPQHLKSLTISELYISPMAQEHSVMCSYSACLPICGFSKPLDSEAYSISLEASQEAKRSEELWGTFPALCSRHVGVIHIPPTFHWPEHSHVVLTTKQYGRDSICTQKKKEENMGLIKHNIYPASICSSVKTDFALHHREDVHSPQKGHTPKSNVSSHFT